MRRPEPADVGGLHLSVVRGPNDKGLWYWRARDAERKVAWTGWASRADAIRTLRELTDEAEPLPTLVTVEDLLNVWVAARAQDPTLSPITQRAYHHHCVCPKRHLGALLIGQLDHAALEGYRNARLGEDAAPRTVRFELLVVRLAWRWAIGRELLHAAALPPVRLKIRGYVVNHRTPSEAEVADVLGFMRGETLLATQLLAVTGARISEVLRLRLRDVDLCHGLLRLTGKGATRSLPLTPGLRRLLTARVQHGGEGRLLRTNADAVREALRAACVLASVQEFTPHGIRRMAVNRLNRAGVDPKVAATITGHSVEVMLSYYRSVSAEEKAKGVRQAGLGQRLSPKAKAGQQASRAQLGAQPS